MFDIGFLELTVLFVIGLLVLGPERLPRVARTLGGYVRKARQTWYSVRTEIERELAAEDLKRSVSEPVEEVKDSVARPAESMKEGLAKDFERVRRTAEGKSDQEDDDERS
ncbi:MAG: Sec-independent protein translocase protein TatB [Xanthomonadales bacterium]|nr:Sec-independent protein translocase protein TatB [Xanthomonadales bacterium]